MSATAHAPQLEISYPKKSAVSDDQFICSTFFSVPADVVCNLNMAKDGYANMSISACFSSPIFTLLAGVACVLAFGSEPGSYLELPADTPTYVIFVSALTSMCLWGLLVVFLFRYRLNRLAGLFGISFYCVFEACYVSFLLTERNKRTA
jgi:Ca2+/Na+ antiporter